MLVSRWVLVYVRAVVVQLPLSVVASHYLKKIGGCRLKCQLDCFLAPFFGEGGNGNGMRVGFQVTATKENRGIDVTTRRVCVTSGVLVQGLSWVVPQSLILSIC
ncbi:unnamed protein product [Choristocarpus tenellus]